jgi:DNA-binding GntR family transcriptional regulator
LKRSTTSDQVYEQLRESIVRGDIPAGAVLNQMDLADQFGVSRVPIREALKRLEAERLIVGRAFQPYEVRSLSAEQILELIDIREVLEVRALERLLEESADLSSVVAQARAIVGSMSPADSHDRWISMDRDLHGLFNDPATEIARIVDDGRGRILSYFRTGVASNERRIQVITEHIALIDAVEQRDAAKAAQILRQHINGTRQALSGRLADEPADSEAGADAAGAQPDVV